MQIRGSTLPAGGPPAGGRRCASRRSRSLALGLALVLGVALAAPASARAENAAKEFGLGASCAIANLVYGPAKTLYASGGAMVAGFAWLFSGGDNEVARPIVDASMRGDFVLERDHLLGRKEIEFVGRAPEQRRMRELAGDSRPPARPRDEGF